MCRVDTRGYAKAKICVERIEKERRGQDVPGEAKELNRIAESGQTKKTGDKYPLFNEKKCRTRGKAIFVTPDWAFKRRSGEHLVYFCKYTCMKHYEERKAANKRVYTRIK